MVEVGVTFALVLLGAMLQRSSGMGFSLVCGALLILTLGPREGLTITLVGAAILEIVVLARTKRDVDWRQALGLVVPALVGIVPGMLLTRFVDVRVVSLVAGLSLLAVLCAVPGLRLLMTKSRLRTPQPRSRRQLVATVTGMVSGCLNVVCGAGGPPLAAYAMVSAWPHASFVATAQAYFLVLDLASLAAVGTGMITPAVAGAAAAGLATGVMLGGWLAVRLAAGTARRLVHAVAITGALMLGIQGMIGLVT